MLRLTFGKTTELIYYTQREVETKLFINKE